MSTICIYWDESHFWGLMVLRALRAWGIPHRLVRGTEIAQGALAGKPCAALVVPGGNARNKTERLGEAGAAAVRGYVASGGTYIGICGGAGLALSGPGGLGLCPWKRRRFEDRMHHFLSGHVHARLDASHRLTPNDTEGEARIPVWWPGQFREEPGEVEVLARYERPASDFWVADLALCSIPAQALEEWEQLYDLSIRPDYLRGRPCVVSGSHGAGRYLLSYPHLETPASPEANHWLAHLLAEVLGDSGLRDLPPLPAWDVSRLPVRWEDPALLRARTRLENAVAMGQSHFLLFWRNPWLIGWRRGVPGAGINSLYSLVCEILASDPPGCSGEVAEFWNRHALRFTELMDLLHHGLTGFLLAERIAMTVSHSGHDEFSERARREQRAALFGPPPSGGGLYGEIVVLLEELYWRIQAIR